MGRTHKVTVVWDKVRTHREAARDDRMYPGYANLSDEERIHRPSDEEVYIDHGPLPPDDRPTMTDLPPVVVSAPPGAGGEEPAEPNRGGEQVLVMERKPPSTVAQRPDNAPGRRRPSPRPRRPLHTEPPHAEPPHTEPPHTEPLHTESVHVETEPSAYAIPEGGTIVAPDEARPDEARPDEARPDEARPDEARPDEARPDEARPDATAVAPPREIEAPDVEPLAVEAPEVTEPDPADELEPEPPREGGIAQFLATTPQHRSVPLAGVNGVSVTLDVSDLQRSRRFYRDTLGLTELDSGQGSAVLASGDARLVLRRVADMPPVDRRVVHLNLDVPDVYEAYERLRAEGVEFVHRPRVVPQGEHLELCSARLRDPDGHAIALTRWELRR